MSERCEQTSEWTILGCTEPKCEGGGRRMAAGANAIKDGNSAPVVITAMRTAPVVVADACKIVMG